jgi:hypothetical protein
VLCDALGVSASGDYACRSRPESARAAANGHSSTTSGVFTSSIVAVMERHASMQPCGPKVARSVAAAAFLAKLSADQRRISFGKRDKTSPAAAA